MLTVIAIQSGQLDAFARVGDHPLGVDGFANAVRDLWASGESRPEWCFVVEENGKWIGRVGYTGSDLTPHELGMMGLHIPWRGDYLAAGIPLLRESLRAMRASGRTHLERRLSSISDFVSEQRALLEKIGLPLAQEKIALSRVDSKPPMTGPEHLSFRSLEDVGEQAFVDAVRRVTDGTLDRIDQAERNIMGHAEHARVYLHFLKIADCQPGWWQLGYAPDGALVGLVIPQSFGDGIGAINYIGVVPQQRGKGYGYELLLKGTAIMQHAGLREMIADVDVLNPPMIRAFEQVGYVHKVETQFVYFGEIALLTDA